MKFFILFLFLMIILFCDTLILLIKNQKKILFKSIKSGYFILKKNLNF